MNTVDEIIYLFEEKEDLEDKIDIINNKLDILSSLFKKERTFKEVTSKKYNRNWLRDF